jgi:hypothetical protein
VCHAPATGFCIAGCRTFFEAARGAVAAAPWAELRGIGAGRQRGGSPSAASRGTGPPLECRARGRAIGATPWPAASASYMNGSVSMSRQPRCRKVRSLARRVAAPRPIDRGTNGIAGGLPRVSHGILPRFGGASSCSLGHGPATGSARPWRQKRLRHRHKCNYWQLRPRASRPSSTSLGGRRRTGAPSHRSRERTML